MKHELPDPHSRPTPVPAPPTQRRFTEAEYRRAIKQLVECYACCRLSESTLDEIIADENDEFRED